MGKYDDEPTGDFGLLYIANELAEGNRLKRLELETILKCDKREELEDKA